MMMGFITCNCTTHACIFLIIYPQKSHVVDVKLSLKYGLECIPMGSSAMPVVFIW